MTVTGGETAAGPPDRHERAAALALATLPRIGPGRQQILCHRFGSAASALARLRRSRVEVPGLRLGKKDGPDLPARWQAAARAVDEHEVLHRHLDAGYLVLLPGDDLWPAAFVHDPHPPALLVVRGDPALLHASPTAAIVGTRRCSAVGSAVAHDLGADLARAGVSVVSGLALGIDGAAHRGVLAAGGQPPVGVVASGLDVVYPARHAQLWEQVATSGVLCTETPLGIRPDRWRFPARNRLIAALADVVVVVESRAVGGSMLTAEAALERGRTVLAVPGSVRSGAADGPNALLVDGAAPVRDATDVLFALGFGLDGSDGSGSGSAAPVPALDPELVPMWDRLSVDHPVPLDRLAALLGLPLGTAATALARLEGTGLVLRNAGGYRRAR